MGACGWASLRSYRKLIGIALLRRADAQKAGMVQKPVAPQRWLGSMPKGQRPQIQGFRAGGSLAVASSTLAVKRVADSSNDVGNAADCFVDFSLGGGRTQTEPD